MGTYGILLVPIAFYWYLGDSIGTFSIDSIGTLLDSIDTYWLLLVHIVFYWYLLDSTGTYWNLLVPMESDRTESDRTESGRTESDRTESDRTEWQNPIGTVTDPVSLRVIDKLCYCEKNKVDTVRFQYRLQMNNFY